MGKLFEEDAGVPEVWTFDGTTVKKRPKKNVDKELREGRSVSAPDREVELASRSTPRAALDAAMRGEGGGGDGR